MKAWLVKFADDAQLDERINSTEKQTHTDGLSGRKGNPYKQCV